MPGQAGPVQQGVRRKRNTAPSVASTNIDSSLVKYNTQGLPVGTTASGGYGTYIRPYVPGLSGGILTNSVGADVVAYYSSGKFVPGTSIRWEPSCSFTTSGRVFVGFTDNPEVASTIEGFRQAFLLTPNPSTYTAYAAQVRALGNLVSFPVWQETAVPFPTRLRRKRFDTNRSVSASAVDVLDRSMQTHMFVAIEGGPDAGVILGAFWFHDVVDVEGLHNIAT